MSDGMFSSSGYDGYSPQRRRDTEKKQISLSLCLCGELFFDAHADGEETAVFAVAPDDHQTHRCGAGCFDRQRQRTTIEEIDDRRVAQQLEVEQRVILVPGE